VALGISDRFVLHAPGNDEELAFVEFDDPVAKVDRQVAVEDQKEFVLVLVMVPDELTFQLGEFDMLSVEFTDDSGAPVFSELLEFFGEVHLVVLVVAHDRPLDDGAHRR